MAELKDAALVLPCPMRMQRAGIFRRREDFCSQHPGAAAYTSLGQLLYRSCIQHIDGVDGDSANGLAEVPSFNKSPIKSANRKRGCLRSASVIYCAPACASMRTALNELFKKHVYDYPKS